MNTDDSVSPSHVKTTTSQLRTDSFDQDTENNNKRDFQLASIRFCIQNALLSCNITEVLMGTIRYQQLTIQLTTILSSEITPCFVSRSLCTTVIKPLKDTYVIANE